MPTPNSKETHDDYINRCMSDQESLDSYPNEEQRYAVCEAKWSEAKMTSIAKYRKAFAAQRISFDYDETLTKPHGMELAQQWIAKGADVYIISARSSVEPMINRAKELGIPLSRVYATGSNKAKVEQIIKLNISKHYDNNPDVIKELGKIGQLYGQA